MCILFVIPGGPSNSLLLCNNRDEYLLRGTISGQFHPPSHSSSSSLLLFNSEDIPSSSLLNESQNHSSSLMNNGNSSGSSLSSSEDIHSSSSLLNSEGSLINNENDEGYVYYPVDRQAGGTWIAFDVGHGNVCIPRRIDAIDTLNDIKEHKDIKDHREYSQDREGEILSEKREHKEHKEEGEFVGKNPKGSRFACVLNFDEFRIGITSSTAIKYKSRGQLAKDFIESNVSALSFARNLLEDLDSFRGFNFIVGDDEGTYFVSNMHSPGKRVRLLDAANDCINSSYDCPDIANNHGNLIRLRPGHLYAIGNGCFDDESWPKIREGKRKINEILRPFASSSSSSSSSSTKLLSLANSSSASAEPVSAAAPLIPSEPIDASELPQSIGIDDARMRTLLTHDDAPEISLFGSKAASAEVATTTDGAVSAAVTGSHELIIPSTELVTISQQLLGVLSDNTHYDDPLFETMSSELARALMGISVDPVIIRAEDEPGCYVKEIDTDILGRPLQNIEWCRSRALRADEISAIDLTQPADATPEDEREGINDNRYLFATRTSTVMILNPPKPIDTAAETKGNEDHKKIGFLLEHDRTFSSKGNVQYSVDIFGCS